MTTEIRYYAEWMFYGFGQRGGFVAVTSDKGDPEFGRRLISLGLVEVSEEEAIRIRDGIVRRTAF